MPDPPPSVAHHSVVRRPPAPRLPVRMPPARMPPEQLPLAASRPQRVHRRRQDIITGLFALSLLSLPRVPLLRRPMLVVHLVVDALLVVYVGLGRCGPTRREKTPAVSYIEPRSTAPMYATVGNDVRRSATR